jgi:hypothetical protein
MSGLNIHIRTILTFTIAIHTDRVHYADDEALLHLHINDRITLRWNCGNRFAVFLREEPGARYGATVIARKTSAWSDLTNAQFRIPNSRRFGTIYWI